MMKRSLIALALLTISFGGQAPAQACLPNDPTQGFFCNYTKIPQSACFNALTTPGMPQPVKDAKPCEKVPAGAQIAGQDLNITIGPTSPVTPTSTIAPDAGSVGMSRSVVVHNLDVRAHTFTSTDATCFDNSSATACRFDETLAVGEWLLFAETVQITASKFTIGTTYSFKCRFHPTETGSFTITA